MENDKVIQYIKNGDERGLLDKLRAYSFTAFNKQIKNLLKILLVLIEEANDKIAPYQFFYKTVVNVLPEIIFEKEKLAEFVILLKTNSLPPYQQTSFLVREFIIGVEDKKFEGAEYEKNKITSEQLLEFKSEMIKVNISLLKKAIDQKLPHDQIMSIFYSCVERLEAERKIIINDHAIKLLRRYITNNPEDYLRSFIRPLYSGGINNQFAEYYLHVAEPFHSQIFPENEYPIKTFFQEAKAKIDNLEVLNDVETFYNDLIKQPFYDGNRSLQLKNPFNNYGITLNSKQHNNIRPELR